MNNVELTKHIGIRIREERLKRNLSIEELAEILDVSSAFVGLIERGQRGASVNNLNKISKYFDLPIDSFFPNEDYIENEFNETVESKKSLCETIKVLSLTLSEGQLAFIINTMRGIKEFLH